MAKEKKLNPFQIGIVCGRLWKASEEYDYNYIERLILKTFMPKTYNHNMVIKKALDDIGNDMFGKEVIVRKIKA